MTAFAARLRWRAAVALMPVIALLASPAGALAIEVNEDFKPQNEFKLDPWIELKFGPVDLSINKAVALLLLAGILTCVALSYVAKRMQDKPNRIQTVVEAAYDLVFNQITKGNMDSKMATKWFGFIATLFFFIWFSNMIGFIPLPTNTEHTVDVFGVNFPAFALYAATANISVPLALALAVWVSYHYEGIREHGPVGYVKSWIPSGVEGPALILVAPIEVLSQFVRLISLTARLFANMLAGHMLILIMGGGMIILLGSVFAAVTLPIGFAFYVFEVLLVASLQAFIFAILSAIYLGGAVAHEH
ncbi:MAG: F0F1 ATP synthase subunit A [Solirubrobacterales bacterium]